MPKKYFKTTVDKVDTSYCHYLISKQKYIWAKANSSDIDTEHLRAIIFKMIKPAPMTDKKIKFYKKVRELETKEEIAMYVSNSCKKSTQTVADLSRL